MSDHKNLNPGWKAWRFDQMATNVNVRIDIPSESGMEHYVGLEHLDAESLKIRRWGSPDDVEATKLMFMKGDIIFGRRRAYQRKLGVAAFDGICSAHAMVLRAKPEVVLPEFLPFFMQSDLFMRRAVEISVGSLSPTINWKTMAAQEFVLPPLEKQQRTIHFLSAVEDQAEAVLHALTAATKLRKSIALEEFSRSDYPIVRMGAVAEIRNGSTPRRATDAYWKGDIPWLPTGKVNERVIRAADEFITEKALSECPLALIPAGATLVAMIGEGQTRGRAAMLAIDSCINQNFGAVIPGSSLDPWYLFYLLESNYEALRHWSQGTNQRALSCGLLKSYPIPVPPLEVQQELVGQLKDIEAAESRLALRLDMTHEMRRAAHLTALSME
ncbi:restriction endonuclease subunit S [Pseudomonas sp. SWI7]|uniref:restriction endonuclease subunit S n=1 Tax=Pseudomonas sp. SWI7 TaxID=2587597 RepID=UPI0015A7D5F6|nr:restriction endonuclease subunit S [Pseudomonas sp. SWI7]